MKGKHSIQIVVGNLGRDTTSEDIRVLFSSVAVPLRVTVATDAAGTPRGFALVDLPDSDGAARAVRDFDGLELGGRKLRVRRKRARAGKGRARPLL